MEERAAASLSVIILQLLFSTTVSTALSSSKHCSGEKKAFSGCSVDPIDEVHGAYFTLLVTVLEHY